MPSYLEFGDGTRVEVRDGYVIGRVPPCEVTIGDAKASRRHAKIIIDRGVVEIEDLDSSNGTTLNGNPVTRRMIRPGDVIGIGTTELRYVEAEAETAAPKDLAATEIASPADLLGGDLMDDDFVDAPIAPPQVSAPPPPPPAPPTAPKPSPAAAAKPSAPPPPPKQTAKVASAKGAKDDAEGSPTRSEHGVLQFSNRRSGGGMFADDIGQASGASKALMILGGVVIAIAVGYAVMQLIAA